LNVQVLFLLLTAFAVFIIGPIALVMTAVEHFRHKASDRPPSVRNPFVLFVSFLVKTAARPILTPPPASW
jgi:hypothetical protein